MRSSVKQQFAQDLQLAGLAASSQKVYREAAERFEARTGLAAEEVSEAQVAAYLQEQIARGLGENSIRPTKCALQLLFQSTLGRQWGLFKKGSPPRGASVCRWSPVTASAAA